MRPSKINNKGFVLSLINGEVDADDGIEFHETEDSRIWIVNPLHRKFDLKLMENLDNTTKHTWEIPGIWSVLIQDKKNNQFRALTSINNEIPWYYSKDFSGILSTSLHILSFQTGLKEPDPISICSYISMDWSVGGYTFIKGIRKSFGGSIIHTGLSIFEKHIDFNAWLGFDNSIDNVDILVKVMVDIMRETLDCSSPEIGLTAGVDSRALVAAALMSGMPFKTTTGISPTGDQIDARVAQKISRILRIEHLLVNASDREAPSFEEIYKFFTLIFDAEYNALNYVIHYKEFLLGPKGITRILGYGGEFFTGFYFNVRKRLLLKLTRFNKKTSEEVLQRIDLRYQKMKHLSERDARDLFYQRERDLFWVSSNIRALLPYRRVFTPFRDPRLLFWAYRFKGGIRACKLHEALILKLPTEIQKIAINRGKLLTQYNKIARRLWLNINYDLLADPQHLLKIIKPDIFNKILEEKVIKKMIRSYSNHYPATAGTLHKMLGIQYFFNSISKL